MKEENNECGVKEENNECTMNSVKEENNECAVKEEKQQQQQTYDTESTSMSIDDTDSHSSVRKQSEFFSCSIRETTADRITHLRHSIAPNSVILLRTQIL
jgi:hypothetical protein